MSVDKEKIRKYNMPIRILGKGGCMDDFLNLENNIKDLIIEEQAKLGYLQEAVRLYYPLSSLNHLLGTDYNVVEMMTALEKFASVGVKDLGNIGVTNREERFCFYIPEEGVDYVYHHKKPNEFIETLVKAIGTKGCTMETVRKIFLQQSAEICEEKVSHGEFDYLIYFKDENIDPYYYCFKDEGHHIIYHRFTKEDYFDFGFED